MNAWGLVFWWHLVFVLFAWESLVSHCLVFDINLEFSKEKSIKIPVNNRYLVP